MLVQNNGIYLAIVGFFSTNKGVKYTSVLFSHGPNKAFLVPDSCRTIKTVTV
jgi:hypothetical protein